MAAETERIMALIKMLGDGEIITYDMLEENELWINENTNEPYSQKTMQRDMDLVEKILNINEIQLYKNKDKNGKKEFRASSIGLFDKFLNADSSRVFGLVYSLISDSGKLSEMLKLDKYEVAEFKKIFKEFNSCYTFINRAFEDLDDTTNLSILERAIKNRQKIKLRYKSNGDIKESVLNPYYIAFMSENFYLICHEPKENMVLKPRVRFIESIELQKETYTKNDKVMEFIKNIQSPFAATKLESQKVKVVLKVDKSVRKYFEAKRFFNSQKILDKEFDDGSIKVEYVVTQELELLYFVLNWSSGVEVLEPLSLRNKVKGILQKALSRYE